MSSLADIVVGLRMPLSAFTSDTMQAAEKANQLATSIQQSSARTDTAISKTTEAQIQQIRVIDEQTVSWSKLADTSIDAISRMVTALLSLIKFMLMITTILAGFALAGAAFAAMIVAIELMRLAVWAAFAAMRLAFGLFFGAVELGFRAIFALIRLFVSALTEAGKLLYQNAGIALMIASFLFPPLGMIAAGINAVRLAHTIAKSSMVQEALQLQGSAHRTAMAWDEVNRSLANVAKTGTGGQLRAALGSALADPLGIQSKKALFKAGGPVALQTLIPGSTLTTLAKLPSLFGLVENSSKKAATNSYESWMRAWVPFEILNEKLDQNFVASKSSWEAVTRLAGAFSDLGGAIVKPFYDGAEVVASFLINLSGIPSIINEIWTLLTDETAFIKFTDGITKQVEAVKRGFQKAATTAATFFAVVQEGLDLDQAQKFHENGLKLLEMEAAWKKVDAAQQAAQPGFKFIAQIQDKIAEDAKQRAELQKIASLKTVEAINAETQAVLMRAAAEAKLLGTSSEAGKAAQKRLQETLQALSNQRTGVESGQIKPEQSEIEKLLASANEKHAAARGATDANDIGRAEQLVKENKATQEQVETLARLKKETQEVTEAKRQAKAVEDSLADARRKLTVAQSGESDARIQELQANNATAEQIAEMRKLTAQTDALNESKKRAKAVDDQLAEARQKLAATQSGESEGIQKAIANGATSSQVAELRKLTAETEALAEARRKAKQAQDEVERANNKAVEDVKRLKDEIAELNGNAKAGDNIGKRLKEAGVDGKLADQVAQLTNERDQLKKDLEAKKKVADDAKQLVEAIRTPQEKFLDEFKKIMELFYAGAIDAATRDKAIAHLRKEQTDKKGDSAEKAVYAGSSEAVNVLLRSLRGRPNQRLETLGEKSNQLLSGILTEAKKKGANNNPKAEVVDF